MSTFSGDESARFFGFIGAAAALVFSVLFFVSSLRSGLVCVHDVSLEVSVVDRPDEVNRSAYSSYWI